MIKTFLLSIIDKTPRPRVGHVLRIRATESSHVIKPGTIVITKDGPGVVLKTKTGLHNDMYAIKMSTRVVYRREDSLYLYYVYDRDLKVMLLLNPNDYFYIARPRQRIEYDITLRGRAGLTTEYKSVHDHYSRINRVKNGTAILNFLIKSNLIK